MSVGSENFHIDLSVEDAVDHTVFLRDFAAPTVRGLSV